MFTTSMTPSGSRERSASNISPKAQSLRGSNRPPSANSSIEPPDGPILIDVGEQKVLEEIEKARGDPTRSVARAPELEDLLVRYQVAAVIANRMIGTGIFNMPTTVIRENHNIAGSLILWALGFVSSIAGTLLYVEYGLTVPRRFRNEGSREQVFFGRSGGELNYLNYLVDRKHYPQNFEPRKKDPWHRFLASCVFGWMFILVGNAAANSIAFAVHFTQIFGYTDPHKGAIQGIAIAVSTCVCAVHGLGRSFGIHLNSTFAIIKFAMLWTIVGLGFAHYSNAIKHKEPIVDAKITFESLDLKEAGGIGGFSRSYLHIIFAYGGFNQANYVLGEVRRPKKMFQWTTVITVTSIGITYMLVNVVYFLVVPIPSGRPLVDEFSISREFFASTVGSIGNLSEERKHIVARICVNTFTAFSSLGNIIVVTFTASRVKQEIAKDGVIPFSKFFRGNINLIASLKKKWAIWRGRNAVNESMNNNAPVLEIERGSSFEPIPLPALLLHCVFTWFLILTTLKIKEPKMSYEPLVGVYSYTIDAMVSFSLAVGLLCMRWKSESNWNDISAIRQRWLSITVAVITLLSNGFPLFALFNPKGLTKATTIPWFVVPTIGWTLLASGFIYWFLFRITIKLCERKDKARFVVRRNPIFYVDEDEWLCLAESNEQAWIFLSALAVDNRHGNSHELQEVNVG